MRYANKLREQLLASATKRVSDSECDHILWSTLKQLVIGFNTSIPPHLREEMLHVIKLRDVRGWLDLTARITSPQLYCDADSYWSHAVIAALLKKYPFGKVPGVDPLSKAKERFELAELLCRQTNKRIAHFRRYESRLYKRSPDVFRVLHTARLKISKWLGDASLSEVASNARLGPGACVGVKRPTTTPYYKYSSGAYTVSARCFNLGRAYLESDPNWCRALDGLGPFDFGPYGYMISSRFKVTDYNNVTFVPKTALTHRAIAIEPFWNVKFQLGAGRVIRDRLRKAGLDLDVSWQRNIELAKLGSVLVDDPLGPSTIDLSMASDTLSIELVRDLLPPDWFDLLDRLRSHNGFVDNSVKRWAKFSSMGNGFTFELETMIFYALSLSVVEELNLPRKDVKVFGDDIIVPSAATQLLFDVLSFCGFRINYDKTFTGGHFRESCGGDFFDGAGVRPFNLKRKLATIQDVIFLRNGILHLFDKGDGGPDPRGSAAVEFIDSRLPLLLKTHLLGPYSGPLDGNLHSMFDKASSSYFVGYDRVIQELTFPSLQSKSLRFSGDPNFVYLQFIKGTRYGSDSESYKPWECSPMSVLSLTSTGGGSRSNVTQTDRYVTKIKKSTVRNWA